MAKIAKQLTELIGHTPLLELTINLMFDMPGFFHWLMEMM